MIAFHGDKKVKVKYLNRVRVHARADELVKGIGWRDGKGCAVGCTLHQYTHKNYETELGIPEMLARLEDTIFEGLPNGTAKKFPARFLKAPKVGADLTRVGWQFLHWLLTQEAAGRDHSLVKDAIAECAKMIEPLTRGEKVAESAAWSAESAARSAARSAAESAAWSAASAAESAARSAAESAESAAESAESAAWSAAESAESAAWSAAESAESAAWSAAESAAYVRMADKLIELMEAAPAA